MLEVRNLSVHAGDSPILRQVSLSFEIGKTYVILGSNGSGKSSLSETIMGHPQYQITWGSLWIDGEDATSMSASERAKRGIFLSLQHVPEIPWVQTREFLRMIFNLRMQRENDQYKPMTPFVFNRFLTKEASILGISEDLLNRDLNAWFSGWEKRRIEMLQAKLLSPKYAFFDEVDSGLDIDALRMVSEALIAFKSKDRAIIVITHDFDLIERLSPDGVVVMADGGVTDIGDQELSRHIAGTGFTK